MPSLKLFCPHCEEEHDDPFEVLDPDTVDSMRCKACEKPFWFAIMECHRCAHEQAFTWGHEPSAEAAELLTCEACSSTFRYHDATTEHPDTAQP